MGQQPISLPTMPPHRETSHRAHASGGRQQQHLQQHFPPLSREEEVQQPPTNDDSHFTPEESATFALAKAPLATLPDSDRNHTKAAPNPLDVLMAAHFVLTEFGSSDAMRRRTPADDESDTAAGGEFAKAEPTFATLKADVERGMMLLASSSDDDGALSGTFSRIRQTIESEWPDQFHEASKLFLSSAMDELETVYKTHARMNVIEEVEVCRTVEAMVTELLAAVCKVHASLPEASTRGADFELGAEIKAELVVLDQQIADLTEADQLNAVLEVQRKKKDLLTESLADVIAVAQVHTTAIDGVCSARAATMTAVGEKIREMMSTCEEKLAALSSQLQSQAFATDIALQSLKTTHKNNTARAVAAQEKQTHTSVSRASEQAALLSGRTGEGFTVVVEKATKAAAQQAEATAAGEKIGHTMVGYDSAVDALYASCGELQQKQAAALLTIQSLQSHLLGLSAIFTKAAAALVETSAGWETLVTQSLNRVRTSKHDLVIQYYRWSRVNRLTPAMKKEVKTGVQVKVTANAEADERDCVDLDDPSALQDAVRAAAKAKEKHDTAVARVAAAKTELANIITTYDFSTLRDQLTAAGVRIGSDPSTEAGPDVSGFLKKSIARLQGMLSLGF